MFLCWITSWNPFFYLACCFIWNDSTEHNEQCSDDHLSSTITLKHQFLSVVFVSMRFMNSHSSSSVEPLVYLNFRFNVPLYLGLTLTHSFTHTHTQTHESVKCLERGMNIPLRLMFLSSIWCGKCSSFLLFQHFLFYFILFPLLVLMCTSFIHSSL